MIYRSHHAMPWSYYEHPMSMNSGGSRPHSPPNNFMNWGQYHPDVLGNNKPVNRKRQRTSRYFLWQYLIQWCSKENQNDTIYEVDDLFLTWCFTI